MATFWLYGDESGIHDGAKWCLVCGYVGREDHWLTFDQKWRKVLTDVGMTNFHAQRFFAREAGRRVPPYHDWDDQKADAFIQALIAVLVAPDSYLHRIGRGVDVKAFLSFTNGERRYLTGGYFLRGRFRRNTGAPTKPYYLAFFDTYIDALSGLPQDEDSVVHFMFDRQNVLQEQAVAALDVATDIVKQVAPEWWLKQIGTLSFGEREKYSALQAADLATHLWYSEAESRTSKTPMDRNRAVAFKALTQRDKQLYVYTREEMERELDKLPAHVRARLKAEA